MRNILKVLLNHGWFMRLALFSCSVLLTCCRFNSGVHVKNFSGNSVLLNENYYVENRYYDSVMSVMPCGTKVLSIDRQRDSTRSRFKIYDFVTIEMESGKQRKFDIKELERYSADLKQYPHIYITPNEEIKVGEVPANLTDICDKKRL